MIRATWLIALLCICACSPSSDAALKDYFFPYKLLSEGPKIYIYESDIDNHPDEVWLHRLVEKHSGTFVESFLFDSDNKLRQFAVEHIVDNGSLLDTLLFVDYDSSGIAHITNTRIEYPNMYMWDTHPNELVFFKLSYDEQDEPNAHTTLIRNRYSPSDTLINYRDSIYKAVQVHTKELVSSYKEGYIEIQMETTELFVKDIGKVSYRKTYDGRSILSYRLKAIMSPKNYVRRYGPLQTSIPELPISS